LPHSVRTGYPHAHTRRKDTNTTAHSNMTARRHKARTRQRYGRYDAIFRQNGVGDPSIHRACNYR